MYKKTRLVVSRDLRKNISAIIKPVYNKVFKNLILILN